MTPDKSDVLYGTLGLMVIKTLEALGPLHGYRIARRIEQISGNQLALNQGTLYPALLKLEQMGWISSKWGTSESGRRVKIYALTRAGHKQLQTEEAQWQRATSIVERFLKIGGPLMTRLRIFLRRLSALGLPPADGSARSTTKSRAIWPKRQRSTCGGAFPRGGALGRSAQFRWRHADHGGVSGRPVFRVAGRPGARPPPCIPHPPQESGVHDDRGSHAGAGDWRQHRDVQRPECRSAPAPSVSVAGTVGDVVDRGSDAEPSRGQIGALGCRTVAESKSELRGHGHLRCRVHDADGS